MGQTTTKLASDIVEDEIAKQSTLKLMKNTKTQNIEQKIDIERSGGDVIIGKINLDASQTISVASVETYKLTGENAADIARKSAQTLIKKQDSPFFQQDSLRVSNSIKSHIESNLSMKNITKNIIKQLSDQQLIIKDVGGNVRIGEVSFKAQASIVSKEFKSAIQGANIGVKILDAMKLKNEVSLSGPLGTLVALGKEVGLSYRQTVIAISCAVALMFLSSVMFFAYMFSGSGDGGYGDRRVFYPSGELS